MFFSGFRLLMIWFDVPDLENFSSLIFEKIEFKIFSFMNSAFKTDLKVFSSLTKYE